MILFKSIAEVYRSYSIPTGSTLRIKKELPKGKVGIGALRLFPRPAPGEQAPRSSGGVIEPFARFAQNGCFRHRIGQKTKPPKGGFVFWWSLLNQSRTVITNHACGVYIIKTEFCISPTQRVVYHQVADECTLKRDEIHLR